MGTPSEDAIRDMLTGEDVAAKAEDPDTLGRIQNGFGEAFAKVKDRLGDRWEDVQDIYQMAFDGSFDMKKETKYAAIGALAYLVSPVDLIPERYFGALGLADDIAVLHFALKYAAPEIERYRQHKLAFGGDGQDGTTPA